MELMAKAFQLKLDQQKAQISLDVTKQKAMVDLEKTQTDAALSQQRSGSLGPPTKFARALTLSASQV